VNGEKRGERRSQPQSIIRNCFEKEEENKKNGENKKWNYPEGAIRNRRIFHEPF
jgi:hypothetical protein